MSTSREKKRDTNLNFEYDLATLVGYIHTKFDIFISTEWRYIDAGAKVVKFAFG
jgi:hypothetical protein